MYYRGLAHIGMIKAMTEAGIPIDMVGGTSMGAFIGAVWCDEVNIPRVTQKSREWCMVSFPWVRMLVRIISVGFQLL